MTRGHISRAVTAVPRVPIVCVMKRAPPAATTWPDAVDEARQVYNRPVRKQGTLDARGFDGAAELVDAKLKDFIRCFSSRCVCPALSLCLRPQLLSACWSISLHRCQVHDLLSKKAILSDERQMRTRYQTVFRESGEQLQVRTRTHALSSQINSPSAHAPSCLRLADGRHLSSGLPS